MLPEVAGVGATPGGCLEEYLNADGCVHGSGEDGGDVPPPFEDVGGEQSGQEKEEIKGSEPGEEGDDADVFELAAQEFFEEPWAVCGGSPSGRMRKPGRRSKG